MNKTTAAVVTTSVPAGVHIPAGVHEKYSNKAAGVHENDFKKAAGGVEGRPVFYVRPDAIVRSQG